MLFSKELFINIQKVRVDVSGRYVICEINQNSQEEPITLCFIYAPNTDCPAFFEDIELQLKDYSSNIIVMGDFNLVLDLAIDRSQSTHNNHRATEKVKEIMETLYLTDVWRDRNPGVKRFLCRNRRSASRIDNVLLSQGLDSMISNVTYLQGLFTDHSAMYISVDCNRNKRGVGYWKMNISLLKHSELIQDIKDSVRAIKTQYSSNDSMQLWLKIKDVVRKRCQRYARNNSSENKLIIAQLSETIDNYEAVMPLEEEKMDIYLKTKADLEELVLKRAESLIFRSKLRWHEYGEQNSRYFFNLEKCRYNAKTCQTVLTEDGELLKSDEEILREQHLFYTNLYRKEDTAPFELKNRSNIRISEETAKICQSDITSKEVYEAIHSMKNEKTPGYDGIPIEFYKVFWDLIKDPLLNMILDCYKEAECDPSVKTGILNLIPKKGKDSRYLKNLRPLTLLNVDYKIIEKILGKRLDIALQEVIHHDQTGFMPGRNIACNIRKVYDLQQFCDNNNIPGVLVNLDFVKCFDRIAHSAIISSLKYFGVPEYIQNWIQILYEGFTIKVQNNGKFTDPIDVGKSVHQGGCSSVQIFLFCAEVIAIELRNCDQIHGIPVEDIVYLLNQYADDMNISSIYDVDSINSIFQKLEEFRDCSGFTLNYEKTDIYRLGPIHHSNAELQTMSTVSWTSEPINVLGVQVCHDTRKVLDNYDVMIEKTKATLCTWKRRQLSLIGKVRIVNTLISSLFVYKMTVLPTMSEKQFKTCDNYITQFIWNGRKSKISLRTLQASKRKGGLKLVNLRNRDAAIKISWIKTLQKEDKMANLVYHFFAPELKHDVWKCNLSPKQVLSLFEGRENPFWEDVMKAWIRCQHAENEDNASRFLWYNTLVRINNAPFYWKQCYLRGLCYVSQLYVNRQLLNIFEANKQFGLDALQYNALLQAVPRCWRAEAKGVNANCTSNGFYDKVVHMKNSASVIYEMLSEQEKSNCAA